MTRTYTTPLFLITQCDGLALDHLVHVYNAALLAGLIDSQACAQLTEHDVSVLLAAAIVWG